MKIIMWIMIQQCFYFQKAIALSEMPSKNKETEVLVNSTKTEVMVEIGNILMLQGSFVEALAKYHEALQKAKSLSYNLGQQLACIGLVKVYSQLGNAEKSLQYYHQFSALEKASGIVFSHSSIVKPVVMDYAMLNRFDDLRMAFESFEDEYKGTLREMEALYDENDNLQTQLSGFLQEYESQNNQIETLQTQRNHYRLAFFGLLAIMLFAWVLFVCYKIVRKNRTKMEKG